MKMRLAKNEGIFDSEHELMCRRGATFLLAWSSQGLCILPMLLTERSQFLRRSAMFAFYEHSENNNFADENAQAWKDAIPAILEASKTKDEVLSRTASEVLDRLLTVVIKS